MNEDNVLFQSEADSVESALPHESLEAETEDNVLVTEPEETVPEETSPEESSSALTELIEAIKTELSNGEAETERSEAVDETDEDGEAYEEEVDLIDDIHGQTYDGSLEVYTLASDSNANGIYQEVVVNRLDNILTCSIITACCAILVLFHTLKKE